VHIYVVDLYVHEEMYVQDSEIGHTLMVDILGACSYMGCMWDSDVTC
jgi:hypothetical protein